MSVDINSSMSLLMEMSRSEDDELENSMNVDSSSSSSIAMTTTTNRFSGSSAHHNNETLLRQLRAKIEEAIKRYSYTSAIFFADKVVTLSKGESSDVFKLAECYFLNGEHQRALHFLERHDLVYANLESLYLAAQTMAKAKQWEDCLDLLGDGDGIPELLKEPPKQDERELFALICLVRGKMFNALENRNRASFWFKEALKYDCFCYEAFEMLVNNHMLSSKEEEELMKTIHTRSEEPSLIDQDWLELIYSCRLKKYNMTENSTIFESLDKKYGLDSTNVDILTARAEILFYNNDFQKCYDLTKQILEKDPYNHGALMPIHLSTLVQLKLKSELFYCSHKLVEENPNSAVSWYGVGCYYYLIESYESSRRYFSKATTIDPLFGPAWVGFGHAFAAQGENDQAMAAYRSASRMLSGYHLPPLCIGMELIRVNNFNLAEQYINQAHDLCSTDPLIFNELGVIYYKNKQYERAKQFFMKVLELANSNLLETWEPTVFNLGHCFRKLRQYKEAVMFYQKALAISPKNPGTYSALGYCHHLEGDLDIAIEYYHRALAIRSDDAFTTEMLNIALESYVSFVPKPPTGVSLTLVSMTD
eukprot:TRINITY_DN10993_c0_g1_i1.p1 TRINITY_DN10993_c0_g1~~TRINITY_DN10993_c0_g1_i1.p1  ORF type:complete len:605 (+),score=160.42 TRINITY_DN10993_c0_g1_i1:44-1816(+)